MRSIKLLFILFLISSATAYGAGIIVAPNPWIPESKHTSTGNLADGIRFINLPDEGEIRIYTVAGDLVRRFDFNDTATHQARWDGKALDGTDAASGVYLWQVVPVEGNAKTGKLIVIR